MDNSEKRKLLEKLAKHFDESDYELTLLSALERLQLKIGKEIFEELPRPAIKNFTFTIKVVVHSEDKTMHSSIKNKRSEEFNRKFELFVSNYIHFIKKMCQSQI